jgi:hypothetical protein
VTAPLLELGHQSCVELFLSYGVVMSPSPAPRTDGLGYMGLVGFVGTCVRGTVLLGCSEGVVRRTFPLPGDPDTDWVGELAQQLLSRMERRGPLQGRSVVRTPPVALRGMGCLWADSALKSTHFLSSSGAVAVGLQVQCTPGVELGWSWESAGLWEELLC